MNNQQEKRHQIWLQVYKQPSYHILKKFVRFADDTVYKHFFDDATKYKTTFPVTEDVFHVVSGNFNKIKSYLKREYE